MLRFLLLLILSCYGLFTVAPAAGLDLPDRSDPAVIRAVDTFSDSAAVLMDEQIRINEIPAPFMGEAARGAYIARRFREQGLEHVTIDAAGNVLGRRSGRASGPGVYLAAHLDTVFPLETDVTVRKEGSRYFGRGISDNASGLVALIALIRALDAGGIETRHDIVFVANVGEEGKGDLRGMRYLFTEGPLKDDIRYFVSVDGSGDSGLVNGGIGSKRYAVTFKGPGGHSWGAFGLANPIHALARAVARFVTWQAPESPKTSFNVGTVHGGTSVNSIPFEATIEVDMRSENDGELAKMEQWFKDSMHWGAEEENAWTGRGNGGCLADVVLIGDRPSGATPRSSFIVQAAIAAKQAYGVLPSFSVSSTDANIPMSLGIPAITVGAGGSSGGAHSLDEWYDPTGREKGLSILLLTLLALAERE